MEERVTADLDRSAPLSELAGIIEQIDHYLFNLTRIEIDGHARPIEVGCDLNLLLGRERPDLVNSLVDAPLQVSALKIRQPFDVALNPEFEHSVSHSRQ